MSTSTAEHWDSAYDFGDTSRSWYQSQASASLRLLNAVGVSQRDSVLDVGAGASTFVDGVLARGHTDISALDISRAGLRISQWRLGADAEKVQWLVSNLLTWLPTRTWDVWHDRALLHFFTSSTDQILYKRALTQATHPGSVAVLGVFAAHGPQRCSDLPVRGYDIDQLADLLGSGWQLLTHTEEQHATPKGDLQPYTWAAFSRQ